MQFGWEDEWKKTGKDECVVVSNWGDESSEEQVVDNRTLKCDGCNKELPIDKFSLRQQGKDNTLCEKCVRYKTAEHQANAIKANTKKKKTKCEHGFFNCARCNPQKQRNKKQCKHGNSRKRCAQCEEEQAKEQAENAEKMKARLARVRAARDKNSDSE